MKTISFIIISILTAFMGCSLHGVMAKESLTKKIGQFGVWSTGALFFGKEFYQGSLNALKSHHLFIEAIIYPDETEKLKSFKKIACENLKLPEGCGTQLQQQIIKDSLQQAFQIVTKPRREAFISPLIRGAGCAYLLFLFSFKAGRAAASIKEEFMKG